MSFSFVEPWHLFLPRDGGHVVAFMGSGGKTTLLQAAAAACAAAGGAAILTTTTRCEVLPGVAAVSWDELVSSGAAALPPVVYVHAGEAEPGKWAGLTPEQVDELGGLVPDRVVLVEVDGAAGLPLKLHRPGEPVWPGRTSLAVVVMGVGAVGSKAGGAVHRLGRVSLPPLADLRDHTVLEWDHVDRLLFAEGGYLDQVPTGVPAALALTGLQDQDDSIGLFEFVGRAMDHPALPLVVFCNRVDDALVLRTACVDRDPVPE